MDASENAAVKEDHKSEIPDLKLVKTSVFLVVFCEILPLEADCTFILFETRNYLPLIAVKALFVTLILFPLAIYVKRNGWKALKLVWGKVAFVVIVVLIRMALDGLYLWSIISRG